MPPNPQQRFFNPTDIVSPALAVEQMVADTTTGPGRAILLDVTVAGTVELVFMNGGGSITINVQANALYEFNWAITTLVSAGTSATLTAWLLY